MRGVQFWFATTTDFNWFGTSPSTVLIPGGNEVCVSLGRSLSELSRMLVAEQLSGGFAISAANGCLMSNDTCIHLLANPLRVCDSNLSVWYPVESVHIQMIYELGVAGVYFQSFGMQPNLTECVRGIQQALSNLIQESELPALHRIVAHFTCSQNRDLSGTDSSVGGLGLLFAGINMIKILSYTLCDKLAVSPPTESILVNAVSNLSTNTECDSFLLSHASEYLLTSGNINPPSETLCNISIDSSPVPSVFVSVGNSSSISSDSGIIKTTSRHLANRIVSQEPASSPCPTSVPAAPSFECEEIGSNDCEKYLGCWISWGPCQSVFLGFYSPRGSTIQVPCPAIPADQSFVQGDPNRVCISACNDPDYILGTDGKGCQPVHPGNILDPTCSGRILHCQRFPGFIFTVRNSCLGRWVAPALADFQPFPLEANLTVQTWVRMNSLALNLGGPGSIVSLLGSFGNFFLGIQYVSHDLIRLVLAAASAHPRLILSSPVPHIRNDWIHVACTVVKTRASFFINGIVISNHTLSIVPASAFMTVQTSVIPENFHQYIEFVNQIHYGPFSVNYSELVQNDDFLALYILHAFPEIDLFNPNFSSQRAGGGFLGISPPGYRPVAAPRTPRAYKRCPSNFCFRYPSRCFDDVCESLTSAWNPFSCTCDLLPRTTTSTRPPSSTVISPGDTFQQAADPNVSALVGGILSLVFVLAMAAWCFARSRAKRRVKRISQSSQIHAIPSTDFLFNDPTIYENYSTLLID